MNAGPNEAIRHVEVPNLLRAVKRRIPKPLKSAARGAVRTYGVRTAARRALPDFLIIGAKRGGTTSLWNWLVRHPHVAPMFPATQQIKSPHYFDINFSKGLDWYRSHFPSVRSLRHAARRDGIRPQCGEASPYYLFHPEVGARIAQALPDVRLVVSLRNPADRAYSNYWERRGSNAENLDTFEAAINAEPQRLAGETERLLTDPGYYSHHHDCHSYLARGCYADQLEALFGHVDPERVLVVIFDDLVADPAGTYALVQRFLRLPIVDVPELEHHHRLPVPPMADQTRARLVEYYRPHNVRLGKLLDRQLDWDR